MNKPTRLHSIILTTFLAGLYGCGGGNSKVQTAFSVNAQLAEERPLNQNEISVATRICYAFQSKSINFRTSNYLNKSFTFAASKTDCQNTKTNYSVSALLRYDNSNNLIYAPNPQLDPYFPFYGKVQTDTSGYLSQLCTKIKSNNTSAISNTTTTNGVKVQISFTREDLDSFMLMYYVQQSNGTYKADSAEKFKIRTQFDYTTGQVLGMDEYYSKQQVCSSYDKVPSSNFEQRFSTFQ